MKEKSCKFCGKKFIPTSSRSVYCNGPHYMKCPVCGDEYEVTNKDKLRLPPTACSYKCRAVRTAQTSLSKYGCKAPGNNKAARDKAKQTMLDKYGVPYAMMNKNIQEKSKQTLLDKYGVDNIGKYPKSIEKSMNTQKLHHNGKLAFNTEESIVKRQQTIMNKYGGYSFLSRDKYISHTDIDVVMNMKCEVDFSRYEEIVSILDQYQINYILGGDGTILLPRENCILHIVSSSEGLVKDYYHVRVQYARSQGYKSICIYNWDDVPKLVESVLLREEIPLEHCVMLKLFPDVANHFLSVYDYQGECGKYIFPVGLLYNNELIEILVVGKRVHRTKHEVELLRWCAKPKFKVIGGGKHMFDFITRDFGIYDIVAYNDIAKFDMNRFDELGMKFEYELPARKHGIVYDCGRTVYTWL